jgi:hypothetical protein
VWLTFVVEKNQNKYCKLVYSVHKGATKNPNKKDKISSFNRWHEKQFI